MLKSIEETGLVMNHYDCSCNGFTAICNTIPYSRLQTLCCKDCRLNTNDIMSLVRSHALEFLVSLDLSQNKLRDDDCIFLLNAMHLSYQSRPSAKAQAGLFPSGEQFAFAAIVKIKKLVLAHNTFTDNIAVALLRTLGNRHCPIRVLDLSQNNLGDKTATALATVIGRHTPHLKHEYTILGEGQSAGMGSPFVSDTAGIVEDGSGSESESTTTKAHKQHYFTGSRLSELRMGWNCVTPSGFQSLLNALNCRDNLSLRVLDLSFNMVVAREKYPSSHNRGASSGSGNTASSGARARTDTAGSIDG
jgi:hypothetical protein